MKRIFSLFLLIFGMSTLRADIIDPVALIAEAQLAYEQGQYEEASQKFEVLVEAFNGAPDLYYGLGNSYYKQQNYARAILNYERCLQRDPSNTDARANLELAQLNCVDKIESIQPIIFVSWSNALRDIMSADSWGRLSVLFFLLFLVGFGTYFFVRKTELRKVGFYGAIIMVFLCSISMFYAHEQARIQTSHDYAIVMAPTVTVRSTPAESGTQLLIIHEGLKVHINQELSGWYEIELSDGNVGWMKASELEII